MTTLLIDNANVNTTDTTDNTKTAPLARKVKSEHEHVDDATQRKDDILHATDAEQGKLDAYRDAENDVVNTIVATIDPKDALKKYCKAGKQTLALAIRRRDSLAERGTDARISARSAMTSRLWSRCGLRSRMSVRQRTFARIFGSKRFRRSCRTSTSFRTTRSRTSSCLRSISIR